MGGFPKIAQIGTKPSLILNLTENKDGGAVLVYLLGQLKIGYIWYLVGGPPG